MNFPHKYIVVILAMQFFVACSVKQEDTKETSSTETEAKDSTILFNGIDLSGWYTYQRQPEPSSEVADNPKDTDGNYINPIGLNNDPLQVFSVVEEEGAPAIRISGETFGILVTEQEFENYHLKIQFKWGEKKYPPRVNEKKDSGILYHSIGTEGAWGGAWMKSLECQVQESDCGDYISVDTVFAEVPAIYSDEDNNYYYTPGADLLTFSHERSYCNKSEDFEKAMGEWNTMEIYTYGGNSVHVVNGKVNNRVYNARFLEGNTEVPLTKGKIQLQSEGAEIFYRNIEIEQITSIPESVK